MANKGTFVKGDKRINRKGRPKLGNTLADKFRDAFGEVESGDYTKLDSAIDKVVTMAQQGNLAALDYALARGWGKLIDRVETNNNNKNYDFSNLPMQDRLKLLELLRQANATVPSDNPDSL